MFHNFTSIELYAYIIEQRTSTKLKNHPTHLYMCSMGIPLKSPPSSPHNSTSQALIKCSELYKSNCESLEGDIYHFSGSMCSFLVLLKTSLHMKCS